MFTEQLKRKLYSFIQGNRTKNSTDILCAQFASDNNIPYAEVLEQLKTLEVQATHIKNQKEKAIEDFKRALKDGTIDLRRGWNELEDNIIKTILLELVSDDKKALAHRLSTVLPHRTEKAIYTRLYRVAKEMEAQLDYSNVKAGDVVTGIVSGIASYGAFVTLPNKSKVLLHVSQMSDEFIDDVEDYLSINDVVTGVLMKNPDGRLAMSVTKYNGGLKKKTLQAARIQDAIPADTVKKLRETTITLPTMTKSAAATKLEVIVKDAAQDTLVSKIQLMRREVLGVINSIFDEVEEEANKTQQQNQELKELRTKLEKVFGEV